MKNIQFNFKTIVAMSAILIASCTYDFPEPDPDTIPSAGNADFTKMISIGNSLTSGVMNATLYNESQKYSFVAILANQLKLVGGGEFNQPDINAVNGCLNPPTCSAGRYYLKGLVSPAPTPKVPGDVITAYEGDKASLNNFGVPGATIGSAQSPLLSQNPYYSRFASDPGTSTMLGDAKAALADGGTFFTFWLGNNDVLGYATAGGSPAGTLTPKATFEALYNNALTEMLSANTTSKGAVANIPNVTNIPFFTTVKYNPIPLDATNAGALTSNLANNYNAFLNGMVANLIISQAEADKRYLSYVAGSSNKILINDETLTDLDPYMAGPYAGLKPYRIARQTTSSDLVCLTAGSYIGKPVDITGDGTSDGTNGVSIPLVNSSSAGALSLKGDDLILIPSEITQIQTAVSDFNTIISAAVTANSSRLVLIDVNTAFSALPVTVNGISLTASLSPPYGGFSLDGIHPNARGYAYIANLFIQAINTKFSANVPVCNPNDYPGNELPVE